MKKDFSPTFRSVIDKGNKIRALSKTILNTASWMIYGLKIRLIFSARENKYIKMKKDFSPTFRSVIDKEN